MDFFKAFNRFSHNLFWGKWMSVCWMGNCLTGCTQRVVVNNSFSHCQPAPGGAPRDQYLAQCFLVSLQMTWLIGSSVYREVSCNHSLHHAADESLRFTVSYHGSRERERWIKVIFFLRPTLITEKLELRYMELSSGHSYNTAQLTPDDHFKCLAFIFSYFFSSIKYMNVHFRKYISPFKCLLLLAVIYDHGQPTPYLFN